MSNGGKFVRAPKAANGWVESDISEDQTESSDNQSNGPPDYSDDLQLGAHETVGMDPPALPEHANVSERLLRLEEMMGNATDARRPGANPLGGPAEPTPYYGPADRGSNIRYDLIPKFPEQIDTHMIWENWERHLENFEMAMSLSASTNAGDRTKLLYISLGKQAQDIINAKNLQPLYRNQRCYSIFVEGVTEYFKTLTDTSAQYQAFHAMRQAKGESIVMFHARLTQKVRLCGYSTVEQERSVLLQLLKGMQNQKLAAAAKIYGHDAHYVVQAATRVEAYEASEPAVEDSPHEVLAVNRKYERSREREPLRKMRKVEGRGFERNQPKGLPQNHRQGQRTRCWRCGFLYHKRDACPALDKTCNTCGRVGHFAVTCRGKPKNTVVNNVQEKTEPSSPRKPLPPGWAPDSDNDQV